MRTSRRAVALAGLAASLVVLAAVGGWLVGHREAPARADDTAVLTAARQDVTDLMTYDYRTIDADAARALSRTTGDFRTTMTQAMRKSRASFGTLRSVSSVKVLAAAVETLAPDHATVILFADQTISNRRTHGPSTDHTRVELTLERVDGAWLVSAMRLS